MKLPRVSINYRVLIPLVVLFLVLTLIFPRTAKFSYDYRKGSPWSHETLLAQFDFPILKTDEQIREEKSRSKSVVIPYYRYRQDIVDNCRKAAEGIDMGGYSYLRPLIVASMDGIYSNGVVPDEGVKLDGTSRSFRSGLVYSERQESREKTGERGVQGVRGQEPVCFPTSRQSTRESMRIRFSGLPGSMISLSLILNMTPRQLSSSARNPQTRFQRRKVS